MPHFAIRAKDVITWKRTIRLHECEKCGYIGGAAVQRLSGPRRRILTKDFSVTTKALQNSAGPSVGVAVLARNGKSDFRQISKSVFRCKRAGDAKVFHSTDRHLYRGHDESSKRSERRAKRNEIIIQ